MSSGTLPWHPASAAAARTLVFFPTLMVAVRKRRAPKGNDSERSLLLKALTTALRKRSPKIHNDAQRMNPGAQEITALMLALAHQMPCPVNLAPLRERGTLCAICSENWLCET